MEITSKMSIIKKSGTNVAGSSTSNNKKLMGFIPVLIPINKSSNEKPIYPFGKRLKEDLQMSMLRSPFKSIHNKYEEEHIFLVKDINNQTQTAVKSNTTLLTIDLWVMILKSLSPRDLSVLALVNSFFEKAASLDILWKPIYLTSIQSEPFYQDDKDDYFGLWKHRFIEKNKGIIKIGQVWIKRGNIKSWTKVLLVIQDIYIQIYTMGSHNNGEKKMIKDISGNNRLKLFNVPDAMMKTDEIEIKKVNSVFHWSKFRFDIHGKKETWHLGVETESERDEWSLSLEARKKQLYLMHQWDNISSYYVFHNDLVKV